MNRTASDDSLSESLEDYLEGLLLLSRQSDRVGTSDIAKAMGVTAASATRAMKELTTRGLVARQPYGAIALTDTGRLHAESVLGKHRALTRFFSTLLGVDQDRVEDMACHLEHVMPDDILQRVVAFSDYIADCPRGRVRWHEGRVEEAGGHCGRCEHDDSGERSCPVLLRVHENATTTDLRLLADCTAEQRIVLYAFCDDGTLHARCATSGFQPGTTARILGIQEGVLTLLGDNGPVLALTAEEAAQILVVAD